MPVAAQGVDPERYQLIPRTLIFITRGESVLLIKGSPQKRIWAGFYNGVGGHVEQGEDVLSAAIREMTEETGLHPDDLWLVGTVTVDTGQKTGIGLYVMKGVSNSGDPLPSEEGELEWVAFSEILEKDLVEDLPILLPRVLKAKRSDPPFSARYYYDGNDQLVVEFCE
jgi:8-oxo-dGTP diphosphatase